MMGSMKSLNFELYSREDYYSNLIGLIEKATVGERVIMATMAFAPQQPDAARVLAALMAASRRGAEVNLIVDAYPLLLDHGIWLGPLWFHKQLPDNVGARWKPVLAAFEELENSGVHCALINIPGRPFTNPYSGRSHIKFAVVGGIAFIGGCNLNAGSDANKSSDIDMMVKLDEPTAVNWVVDLGEKMLLERNVHTAVGGEDLFLKLSSKASLLLDAGQRYRSIIFDHALALIDAAQKHIFITCQFFPNDVTSQHLLAAHNRGVAVEIRYSPPSAHGWPNNILHQGVVKAAKLKLPKSFFEHELDKGKPLLHAKLIATDEGAIVGSHNYVTAGVKLGTAEIALINYDPLFAAQAKEIIMHQLK
jgi:cardiolipin synthase